MSSARVKIKSKVVKQIFFRMNYKFSLPVVHFPIKEQAECLKAGTHLMTIDRIMNVIWS